MNTTILGTDPFMKSLRRGWYLGTEEFRQELLAQMGERIGENHYGEERAQSQAQKAEQIVEERLKGLGWEPGELKRRVKGDPEKVKLAAQLRLETTATIKWIAQRLNMGTATHLNHLLYWHRRKITNHLE